MYQLILFNIIQNSVKYNQFKGDIIIVVDCLPMKKSLDDLSHLDDKLETYMLETQIIDTGIGIEQER